MKLEDLKKCFDEGKSVFYDDKIWDVVFNTVNKQDIFYLIKYKYKHSSDWTSKICDIETVFVNDCVLNDVKYVRKFMKTTKNVDSSGKEYQEISFSTSGWDKPGDEVIDESGNIVYKSDGTPMMAF